MMIRRLFLPLAAMAAASTLACGTAQKSLPLEHSPKPTTPAITAADLMTRLYIFAADSMQGREEGTLGNIKATDYIAAELKRMGVVPGGDDGTYFQDVPYRNRSLDPASSLTVNGQSLRLGDDFIPMGRGGGVTVRGLKAVYGGTLSQDGGPAITAAQAKGKLVVLTQDSSGNTRRLRGAQVPGAAAVAVVGLDQMPARFRGYSTRPRGFLDDPSAEHGAAESAPVLLVSDAAAARMFSTPLAQLHPGAAGATVDIDVRYQVQNTPYPSRNVIGIIPGSDPALRGEYVVIGAHNDHNGMTTPVDHDSLRIYNQVVRPEGAETRGAEATPEQQAEVNQLLAQYRAAHPGAARMDSIANGADDDGSGSVVILEIAQKIAAMNPRPKRSILLIWHVGEEKGLIGSTWFTDHPTVPRDSIVTELNMDMVGRGDASDETGHDIDGNTLHGGPNYLMLVGSRRLSTELGDLVEQVNTEDGHNLTLDYSFDAPNHPDRIYQRSDHYEYARYGIPVVFFTTGLHRDYHQVTDEPEYVDYPHMEKTARFVDDLAVHIADMDHRLRVDHPVTAGN